MFLWVLLNECLHISNRLICEFKVSFERGLFHRVVFGLIIFLKLLHIRILGFLFAIVSGASLVWWFLLSDIVKTGLKLNWIPRIDLHIFGYDIFKLFLDVEPLKLVQITFEGLYFLPLFCHLFLVYLFFFVYLHANFYFSIWDPDLTLVLGKVVDAGLLSQLLLNNNLVLLELFKLQLERPERLIIIKHLFFIVFVQDHDVTEVKVFVLSLIFHIFILNLSLDLL